MCYDVEFARLGEFRKPEVRCDTLLVAAPCMPYSAQKYVLGRETEKSMHTGITLKIYFSFLRVINFNENFFLKNSPGIVLPIELKCSMYLYEVFTQVESHSVTSARNYPSHLPLVVGVPGKVTLTLISHTMSS